MGYTGLSREKWTFWLVIKAGLVGKIKIQSCSPVTTTHHHVSGHCHVVDRLILSFSLPPLPPLLVLLLLFSPSPAHPPPPPPGVLSALHGNILCKSEI